MLREHTIEQLIQPMADPTVPGDRRLLGLVLPPWQRPEVWNDAQKQRFVEGIFLGFGCGQYVINGLEWLSDGSSAPMSGWLLDGQQRISALRDFLETAQLHGAMHTLDQRVEPEMTVA
jgi:hypothetical protein